VAVGSRLLVDVEFGPRHRLYALSQGVFPPGNPEGSPAEPNTGALVKANRNGTFSVLIDRLNQPTSLELLGRTAYVVTLTWASDRPPAAGRVRPLPHAFRAGAVGGDQDAGQRPNRPARSWRGPCGRGEAKNPAAALELGQTEFQETVGSDGRSSLLGSAVRPDGSVQFDLAIVGGAETGGGFTAAAAGALLCARVTSTLGRDARVAIADLPCPTSLTSKVGTLYGLIDQVVTLKG
jgi:hypothetical protein